MPTIPTPFIGGSDSPRRDTEGKDKLAPPFVPDATPRAGDEPTRAGRRESGSARAEFEAEAIIPVEVVDDVDEVDEEAGTEAVADSAEDRVTEESEAAAAAEAAPPDWLVGVDSPAPEEPAQPTQEAAEPPAAPSNILAATAQQLQRGELRGRIQELIVELGPCIAEVAIARAFAAGYLAAKEPEGTE